MKTTEKILQEVHDQIDFQNKRSIAWLKVAEQIEPLLEDLETLGLDITFYSTLSSRSAGDRSHLAQIFRIFRRHGFKCGSARPKKDSTSWDGHFSKEGFHYTFFFYFASTVCQMVQVGTKTMEVPIYEVRCGAPDGIGVPFVDEMPF